MYEAKSRALKQKATLNWATVIEDVNGYLLQQSKDDWRKTFVPLFQGVYDSAGAEWGAQLGLAFDVVNLEAAEWFQDYTLKFANNIVATTESDMRALLTQAELEGWSNDEAIKRLGLVFDQYMKGDLSPADFKWFNERMPAFRREMIVRTESIRMYNAGSEQIFQKWGVTQKQWWAKYDERLCLYCEKMHGKTLAVGGNWFNAGESLSVDNDGKQSVMNFNYGAVGYPPLHVNCRCALLPVIGQPLTP